VTINGAPQMNFTLYYNNAVVTSTTNGTIRAFNGIFTDITKLKIRLSGMSSIDLFDSDDIMGSWQ